MKKLRVSFAAISFIGLMGCSTPSPVLAPDGTMLNRIPGTEPICIPPGISDKAALDAVDKAITSTQTAPRYWNGRWCMEGRDTSNKWIKAGYTIRKHYLCVCWRIEAGKLIPDVPTSVNLNQDGCSIHRKVPTWINLMRPTIIDQLYKASK